VADRDESGDAADGEEITNKIPRIGEALEKDSSSIAERRDANRSVYEMCPIYADFKHFMRPNPKNFADPRKVSSIM